MIKILKKKRIKIALIIIILCYYFTHINNYDFRKVRKEESNLIYMDNLKCNLPKLNFDFQAEHLKPKPKCLIKQNWGEVDSSDNKWIINSNLDVKLNSMKCKKRKIERINDFEISFDEFSDLKNGDIVKDEVFEVQCNGVNKITNKTEKFQNVYVQIINNEANVQFKIKKDSEECYPYNIMLLSYDSVSKVSFIKRLPKTVDYINKTENFFILSGYNILGDGTPAALIPLYTGFTEEELPSALKNDPNGKYVDEVYPFIWKELHLKNYTSIYMEDWPRSGVGAFTYRMRGFKNHTTKHYPKQYQIYLKMQKKTKKIYDYCNGDTTKHKITLDVLTSFKKMYKNLQSNIAIMHYIENSHDTNDNLHWLDDEIHEFLINGFQQKYFEDTIIFLYSDHGLRFNKYKYKKRSQRFLEERLPFISVYLPDSFIKRNNEKFSNFKNNFGKLISAFDVHATVRDLTCLKREKKSDRQRALSLFDKISVYRSCEDIGIAEHFCTCVKDWNTESIDSLDVKNAADFFVNTLNSITSSKRDLCMPLRLKEIISSEKLVTLDKILFRITIIASPNNGVYETIVQNGRHEEFAYFSESFSIKSKNEISRIDAYGEQPWCVAQFGSNPGLLLDLRKFCFCYQKIKN